MSELDKICTILDKLTLDTLTLIEEHVQLKLNLEDAMRDGETNLAKSRYILGQNSVSKLQLPNEDWDEFKANVVVDTERDADLGYNTFDVRYSEEKLHDPLRWFGILIPQTLHAAQASFRQAVSWIGQICNTQEKVNYNCEKIARLKQIKNDFKRKEIETS